MESTQVRHHDAWNKGKPVGQKAPFKLKEIWAIRICLEMQGRLRELVLFDLGIDSKLRACDLENQVSRAEVGQFPVSRPGARLAPPRHSAVRPYRA